MSAVQSICAVRNLLIFSGIALWADWPRLTVFLFLFFGEIVCFSVAYVVAAPYFFPSPAFLYFIFPFFSCLSLALVYSNMILFGWM